MPRLTSTMTDSKLIHVNIIHMMRPARVHILELNYMPRRACMTTNSKLVHANFVHNNLSRSMSKRTSNLSSGRTFSLKMVSFGDEQEKAAMKMEERYRKWYNIKSLLRICFHELAQQTSL